MSEIADFLRARYTEARDAEARKQSVRGDLPFQWTAVYNQDGPHVMLGEFHRVGMDEFFEKYGESAADPDVIADLDAKLALVDDIEPPPVADPEPDDQTPQTGWCCTGYAAECPLCPQYGTGVVDQCPGHVGTGPNKTRVVEAQLHARGAYPGYEYRTTEGARKQWDDIDAPPADENGDPDPTWERNVDAGRPGQGWDRFDYTEESYWRRPRPRGPRPAPVPRTLKILAQPFAGHPDHKGEEWAP